MVRVSVVGWRTPMYGFIRLFLVASVLQHLQAAKVVVSGAKLVTDHNFTSSVVISDSKLIANHTQHSGANSSRPMDCCAAVGGPLQNLFQRDHINFQRVNFHCYPEGSFIDARLPKVPLVEDVGSRVSVLNEGRSENRRLDVLRFTSPEWPTNFEIPRTTPAAAAGGRPARRPTPSRSTSSLAADQEESIPRPVDNFPVRGLRDYINSVDEDSAFWRAMDEHGTDFDSAWATFLKDSYLNPGTVLKNQGKSVPKGLHSMIDDPLSLESIDHGIRSAAEKDFLEVTHSGVTRNHQHLKKIGVKGVRLVDIEGGTELEAHWNSWPILSSLQDEIIEMETFRSRAEDHFFQKCKFAENYNLQNINATWWKAGISATLATISISSELGAFDNLFKLMNVPQGNGTGPASIAADKLDGLRETIDDSTRAKLASATKATGEWMKSFGEAFKYDFSSPLTPDQVQWFSQTDGIPTLDIDEDTMRKISDLFEEAIEKTGTGEMVEKVDKAWDAAGKSVHKAAEAAGKGWDAAGKAGAAAAEAAGKWAETTAIKTGDLVNEGLAAVHKNFMHTYDKPKMVVADGIGAIQDAQGWFQLREDIDTWKDWKKVKVYRDVLTKAEFVHKQMKEKHGPDVAMRTFRDQTQGNLYVVLKKFKQNVLHKLQTESNIAPIIRHRDWIGLQPDRPKGNKIERPGVPVYTTSEPQDDYRKNFKMFLPEGAILKRSRSLRTPVTSNSVEKVKKKEKVLSGELEDKAGKVLAPRVEIRWLQRDPSSNLVTLQTGWVSYRDVNPRPAYYYTGGLDLYLYEYDGNVCEVKRKTGECPAEQPRGAYKAISPMNTVFFVRTRRLLPGCPLPFDLYENAKGRPREVRRKSAYCMQISHVDCFKDLQGTPCPSPELLESYAGLWICPATYGLNPKDKGQNDLGIVGWTEGLFLSESDSEFGHAIAKRTRDGYELKDGYDKLNDNQVAITMKLLLKESIPFNVIRYGCFALGITAFFVGVLMTGPAVAIWGGVGMSMGVVAGADAIASAILEHKTTKALEVRLQAFLFALAKWEYFIAKTPRNCKITDAIPCSTPNYVCLRELAFFNQGALDPSQGYNLRADSIFGWCVPSLRPLRDLNQDCTISKDCKSGYCHYNDNVAPYKEESGLAGWQQWGADTGQKWTNSWSAGKHASSLSRQNAVARTSGTCRRACVFTPKRVQTAEWFNIQKEWFSMQYYSKDYIAEISKRIERKVEPDDFVKTADGDAVIRIGEFDAALREAENRKEYAIWLNNRFPIQFGRHLEQEWVTVGPDDITDLLDGTLLGRPSRNTDVVKTAVDNYQQTIPLLQFYNAKRKEKQKMLPIRVKRVLACIPVDRQSFGVALERHPPPPQTQRTASYRSLSRAPSGDLPTGSRKSGGGAFTPPPRRGY